MIRSLSNPARFLVLASVISSCAGSPASKPLSIPDLEPGAALPSTPQILAPGIVSTQHGERDAAFMPDHSAFYYTLWTGRFGVIVELTREDDGWSRPSVASFSGRYSDLEPFVTPDGRKLFFASNRPVTGAGEAKDYDIWYVERQGDAWTPPTRLGDSVNTAGNEFYPSLDTDGNLYFTAAYDHSLGGEDIWMSRYEEDRFGVPENAGPGVNSVRDEFNSLIAPDGSFLAFSSYGRDDGLGGGDLYLSFRDSTGNLGAAVNAGPTVNTEYLDFSPALSPDGRTFLFSSRRTSITTPNVEPWSYDELFEDLDAPANGELDIYRIDAAFLQQLNSGK